MSPGMSSSLRIWKGFPRVSGDEPYGSWVQTIEGKFSPRERG